MVPYAKRPPECLHHSDGLTQRNGDTIQCIRLTLSLSKTLLQRKRSLPQASIPSTKSSAVRTAADMSASPSVRWNCASVFISTAPGAESRRIAGVAWGRPSCRQSDQASPQRRSSRSRCSKHVPPPWKHGASRHCGSKGCRAAFLMASTCSQAARPLEGRGMRAPSPLARSARRRRSFSRSCRRSPHQMRRGRPMGTRP